MEGFWSWPVTLTAGPFGKIILRRGKKPMFSTTYPIQLLVHRIQHGEAQFLARPQRFVVSLPLGLSRQKFSRVYY